MKVEFRDKADNIRKGRIKCGRGVHTGRERNSVSEHFLEYQDIYVWFSSNGLLWGLKKYWWQMGVWMIRV